ncbi:hypothetical protein [Arsenicibacter rosenii]|uniref:Uncharacterized protein n=1 Tax=Arsenicibacter rosenii TaxID=1750698 RepID=A0A1S2VQZ9_9BACT|nr:hypothetical protein [Arsenicibacter rosenii]OIN61191.1 hypothetical protein BLX24_03785 [Arsenicibacter rosenii]
MKLTILVKPYVRRWLLHDFGPEPIRVRANSDLGAKLLLGFGRGERIPLDVLEVTDQELPDHKGMVEISFQLGEKFQRSALSAETRLMLSNALLAEFRTALHYYCIGRRTLFNSELSAVKIFLKQYRIPEDELTEESAIKMAQRERRERSDFRTRVAA